MGRKKTKSNKSNDLAKELEAAKLPEEKPVEEVQERSTSRAEKRKEIAERKRKATKVENSAEDMQAIPDVDKVAENVQKEMPKEVNSAEQIPEKTSQENAPENEPTIASEVDIFPNEEKAKTPADHFVNGRCPSCENCDLSTVCQHGSEVSSLSSAVDAPNSRTSEKSGSSFNIFDTLRTLIQQQFDNFTNTTRTIIEKLDTTTKTIEESQKEEVSEKNDLKEKINDLTNTTRTIKEEVSGIKEEVSETKEKMIGMDCRINDLTNTTRTIKEEVSGIKEKMIGMDCRINDLTNTTQTIKEEVSGSKEKMIGMDCRINDLTNTTQTIKEEVSGSKEKMTGMGCRVNDVEQNMRANNVVIMGIPTVKEDKELRKTVKQVADYMEVEIKHEDMVECYRLNPKIRDSPILVSFRERSMKIQLMKRRKELAVVRASDCGLESTKQIFINDDMTLYNQLLFKKAREMKKLNYKYVWFANGHIFVRKNDSGPVYKIRNEEDVNAIPKLIMQYDDCATTVPSSGAGVVAMPSNGAGEVAMPGNSGGAMAMPSNSGGAMTMPGSSVTLAPGNGEIEMVQSNQKVNVFGDFDNANGMQRENGTSESDGMQPQNMIAEGEYAETQAEIALSDYVEASSVELENVHEGNNNTGAYEGEPRE